MSGEIRVGFTESGCFHPAVTRTLLEFRQALNVIDVCVRGDDRLATGQRKIELPDELQNLVGRMAAGE